MIEISFGSKNFFPSLGDKVFSLRSFRDGSWWLLIFLCRLNIFTLLCCMKSIILPTAKPTQPTITGGVGVPEGEVGAVRCSDAVLPLGVHRAARVRAARNSGALQLAVRAQGPQTPHRRTPRAPLPHLLPAQEQAQAALQVGPVLCFIVQCVRVVNLCCKSMSEAHCFYSLILIRVQRVGDYQQV